MKNIFINKKTAVENTAVLKVRLCKNYNFAPIEKKKVLPSAGKAPGPG